MAWYPAVWRPDVKTSDTEVKKLFFVSDLVKCGLIRSNVTFKDTLGIKQRTLYCTDMTLIHDPLCYNTQGITTRQQGFDWNKK